MPSAAAAGSSSPGGASTSRSMASPSSSKGRKSKSRSGGEGDGQLSVNEKRMWKTILDAPQSTIVVERLQRKFGDLTVEERNEIMNSLSKKSLISYLRHNQELAVTAITKKEASIIGQLEELERVVYVHIRDTGNEGIWTKHLKQRANVHQTTLTRALKALETKNYIKAVKSVKYPTRKIFMLSSITPSVELSGGPWYTDNELDSEFINALCSLLHTHIVTESWPKRSQSAEANEDPSSRLIYPSVHLSSLPTVASCLEWVTSAKITTTVLLEEHIQTLLDVLVYDGKVEKIPFVRVDRKAARRRAKSNGRHGKEEWRPRKGQRDGYETQSDEEEASSSDADRSSDLEELHTHGQKRKRGKTGREKDRTKSSKRNSSSAKSIRLTDDEESESDDEEASDGEEFGDEVASVYRALRPLRIEAGWIDVPCSHCPVFDFCQPGGPVNAEACLYFRDWTLRTKKANARENGEGDDWLGANEDTRIAYDDEEVEEEEEEPAAFDEAAVGLEGLSSAPQEGEEEIYSEGEVD